jgi:hypothetical protein
MAGLGRKTFTAGEVLTAANVQGYLMDQTVMVFADDTARDTAIPSPTDGMFVYTQDVNSLFFYNGSASAWTPFSAGAKGGGTDQVFYENDQTVTTDYTLSASVNAMTAGPINIDPSATVTVPSGQVWTIV